MPTKKTATNTEAKKPAAAPAHGSYKGQYSWHPEPENASTNSVVAEMIRDAITALKDRNGSRYAIMIPRARCFDAIVN